jgi:hypothetical protein
MERAKVYKLGSEFDHLLSIILGVVSEEFQKWDTFKTRSGMRYVNELLIDKGKDNLAIIVPECLVDVHRELIGVVKELIKWANKTTNSPIMPFQVYLCYYRDGNDVCPMHSHPFKQITLSIGSERTMKVENKQVKLESGTIIFLDGEKHGILSHNTTGHRLSMNLFYK